MNWNRTILAALAGGVATWLVGFLLHGVIMASTYTKYSEVFSQEQANPLSFLVVEIFIALPAAVLFARTRGSWAAGVGGGVTFGFWLGLVGAFTELFNPIVLEGFPYYLGWCWWGIHLITFVVLGAVLGATVRAQPARISA